MESTIGPLPLTVKLYLIRHAHALPVKAASDDSSRPLSPRGRTQVAALAAVLKGTGEFTPATVWHSPLCRARETAERLADRLKLKAPLVTVAGLRPDEPPESMAERLIRAGESVAVVGHNPQLSAVASLLVTGNLEPPVFDLKKGSILALDREAGRWTVRWLITPDLFT